MKLKLAAVLNSLQLLEDNRPTELPSVFALKVSRIIRTLNTEKETFEKIRRDLVMKFGVQKGDAGDWSVETDKMKDFQSELVSTLESEIEIQVPTLTEEEFNKATEKLNLPPKFVDGLLNYIT